MTNSNTPKKIECLRCEIVKPVIEFNKDASRPSGIFPYCKSCSREIGKINYRKYKDSDTYKKIRRRNQKKYYENNKDKVKAHAIASRYKDRIKKSECENCGDTDQLHMHHPDHSKPLEVITLCVSCHEVAHHGRLRSYA